MRRLRFTLGLVLALVVPAGASAHPVDFEMRAPVAGAASAGEYRSPVLRAPRRFDLVGLRWASRAAPHIDLRARKRGGRWTKWTHVPSNPDDAPDAGMRERTPRGFSAPVWTGDADYVQYRLSRRVPGLRLHFVSVDQRAERARSAARRQATAPGGPPAIQPRAAWGAEDCEPRGAPDYGEVHAALVHHTVSANEYAAEEVPSIVLSICRYHRNSNGWNDIGYNFVVDKFGTLWEGRAGGIDQAVIGAQAQGYNSQTTGIAAIGTHSSLPATAPMLDALAALIRWKLPLHGAPTQGDAVLTSGGGSVNRYRAGTQVTMNRISGHRDGNSTECPGEALYAQLPDLRGRVGNVQPTGGALSRTKIDAMLTPKAIVYPDKATVSGVLRQINGEPVPNAPLEVQAFGASGWRTTWRTTTAGDGGFNTEIGARLSHDIRVRFAGDPGRLPTASRRLLLKVVPELKIQRSAARRSIGQTVTLSGTVQPNRTRLVMVVERRTGGTKKRGTLKVRARGGRFARTYRLRSSGLFRFYVAFKGDERNAAARSSAVYVRATPGASSTPQGGAGEPEPEPGSGGGVSPGGGSSAR
jgi:hypothetical protein